MTPLSDRNQEEGDLALADLVEEINDRLQAGEAINPDTYAAKHPRYADRLRELLPTLQAMADLGHSFTGSPQVAPQQQAGPPLTTGVLGEFRILREVGRGGMGVVYEAEQVSLGRRLALKVLPFAATLDRRQLQRFHNEGRAAAALEHPNIVHIYSVGCDRGVHYYAMQFVEGRTLAQVIDELREKQAAGSGQQAGGKGTEPTVSLGTSPQPLRADPQPLNPEPRTQNPEPRTLNPEPSLAPDTQREVDAAVSTKGAERSSEFFRSAVQLGVQAAEALEHAHQMGVVHRDIKPSNLMVDTSGHLWVTDFGLAMTQKDPALTMTGDIVGTLRYMSPEQALGKRSEMNHRTDIYSLGVTLYELLTLQPAFAGDNRETLVRRLLEDDPPRPRTVSRAIPKDLETIVLKATAKEPQQRYASAQELADDLKRFLADEPIRARRAGPVVRLKKWTRRHKAVTAIMAVTLVAATIFGTVTAVQAYQRDVRLGTRFIT